MIELGSIRVSEIKKAADGSFPVCLGKIHPTHKHVSPDILADFQRRVKEGSVLGECGHPRPEPVIRSRQVGRVADWCHIHLERAAFYIDKLDVSFEGHTQVFHGVIRSTGLRFEHNLDWYLNGVQPSVIKFGMRALAKPYNHGEPMEITHLVTWDLVTSFHRAGARSV